MTAELTLTRDGLTCVVRVGQTVVMTDGAPGLVVMIGETDRVAVQVASVRGVWWHRVDGMAASHPTMCIDLAATLAAQQAGVAAEVAADDDAGLALSLALAFEHRREIPRTAYLDANRAASLRRLVSRTTPPSDLRAACEALVTKMRTLGDADRATADDLDGHIKATFIASSVVWKACASNLESALRSTEGK